MKVLIRKVNHSDYLGVIDLYNEYNNKNIMYHDISTYDFKKIIVAEAEGKIIACAEINILNNEIENYKYSYITNLCIKKKYQSDSVIKLLFQAIEKITIQQKCKKIILDISSKQQFETYKKINFKKTDSINLIKDLESN